MLEMFTIGFLLLLMAFAIALLVVVGLKGVAQEEAWEREKVVNDVLKKLEERSIGGYITWMKR